MIGSIPAWTGEPVWTLARNADGTVYPRVDGGTRYLALAIRNDSGLSPRGRGNLTSVIRRLAGLWSIPAWTGEPSHRLITTLCNRVYPRVDGGTPLRRSPESTATGLSPRGRGNPFKTAQIRTTGGSIPAWTGEPWWLVLHFPHLRVYPRVDGGTPVRVHHSRVFRGLSPRGRGNLVSTSSSPPGIRSIPAWTGEPHHSQ